MHSTNNHVSFVAVFLPLTTLRFVAGDEHSSGGESDGYVTMRHLRPKVTEVMLMAIVSRVKVELD
jgi:hypothetical protein